MRKQGRTPSLSVTRWFLWAGLVSTGAVAWIGSSPQPATAQDTEGNACVDWHAELVASTHSGPHTVLDRDPAVARLHGVRSSCGGCHGDTSEHLESGDTESLFSFGDSTTASQRSARCLSCHVSDQPRFHATSHAQIGLDCTSCHSTHGDLTESAHLGLELSKSFGELDASSATCAECHTQALVAFDFNERHRLKEGILGCSDCHDPHAPSSRRLLGGFKQQQCAQCHVDKSGPFVFEHGSVMVDGCVACHEPHGGPNRYQLKFQSVADLCYSCHIAVPGFHARFTNETVCTNCHSSIHGSNFHPAFLQ